MTEKVGPNSAVRISGWNGCMLGTPKGNLEARKRRAAAKPRHLWVATRCGPYSQMQNINQRTNAQRKGLEENRAQVRKEYAGAVKLAYDQVADGGDVTWEWPDRCGAWELKMIKKMIKDLGMVFALVAGCEVGVRDPKSGKPMKKMWKLATTNVKIACRMAIDCAGGHEHVPCESGAPAATAYYPRPIANRAVDVMLETAAEEPSASMMAEELPSMDEEIFPLASELLALAGSAKELSAQEKRAIHRHLQNIHSGSGHCSNEALVRALRRKGARPEVIKEAEQFRCSSCEENKKQGPRPQASLEAVPRKPTSLSGSTPPPR